MTILGLFLDYFATFCPNLTFSKKITQGVQGNGSNTKILIYLGRGMLWPKKYVSLFGDFVFSPFI